jgi:uncharacterized protein YjbI with pentapeptide repeats
MANAEHLALLKQGTAIWNDWRKRNPRSFLDLGGANLKGADLSFADLGFAELGEANLSRANLSEANLEWAHLERANLSEADLSRADLTEAKVMDANLSRANLRGANLRGAKFWKVDFSEADLRHANLCEAELFEAKLDKASLIGANFRGQAFYGANFSNQNLSETNFSEADLREADFSKAILSNANLNGANLSGTNLSDADLRGANLNRTELIGTNFSGTNLTGSSIYGIAAWDVKLTSETRQENLIITPPDEPAITVDNIKVAQFIYLLLNNEEVRDVIDTITSKAVLILGRFSPERKIILDRLREELRTRHYVPILFDFEKPKSRDTIETIRTLAGMSKFIIADLTDAKAVVQELQAIVPNLPSVAVRFIIKKSEREPGMFDHIRRFPWVLDGAFEYDNPEEVIESINDNILEPVEAKLRELTR